MSNFDNKLYNLIWEIESDLSEMINHHGCTGFWMPLKEFPSFRRNFNKRFTFKQQQRLVELINNQINYRYQDNTFTRYEIINVNVCQCIGNLCIYFYVLQERYN